MADEADDKAPWTIKAVPVATREAAVICARKQGQTMGEWIARAVKLLADMEAGERVIPPDEHPRQTEADAGLPAVIGPPPEVLQAIAAIAHASGRPVPKDVAGHAYALARNQLRVARGLPPGKPRQTKPRNRQTIDG